VVVDCNGPSSVRCSVGRGRQAGVVCARQWRYALRDAAEGRCRQNVCVAEEGVGRMAAQCRFQRQYLHAPQRSVFTRAAMRAVCQQRVT